MLALWLYKPLFISIHMLLERMDVSRCFLFSVFWVACLARDPRFYQGDCRAAKCFVAVNDPGTAQVFYENIQGGKVIVYELTDTLGDSPLFVEVYLPATQGAKMCDGGQVSVHVKGKIDKTWQITTERTTGLFEPFSQIALKRIGETYENNSPIDLNDKVEIHLTGPAHNLDCHIAVRIGKQETLDFATLMEYPPLTFHAWNWGWKRSSYNAIVFTFLGASFLTAFLTFMCREERGGAMMCAHLALAFYLSVFVIRAVFMMNASSEASDTTASHHLVAIVICFLDFLFLLAVCIYVFGKWFQKIGDTVLCCRILCCPCRLFFVCLEEQGSIAASTFVIVLAVLSLFVFSAGFYLGPVFLLLSAVVALIPESTYSRVDIY
jgi:hypothetical protein